MRELEALIRDIDREIERAFEQTFEATAKNFEEMVEHLFPGGRGRLRRVSLRPVRDEERPAASRRPRRRGAGAGGRGGRGARRARGRDRGHPGRQVDPQALAALGRREVAGRARLRLRRLPRPAVPLLHPRRGRGRPRRRQHRPLPAADPPLLRPRPVRHRHPPETDDGRRRRPLRGQHGRRRRHQGRLPAPAARRRSEEDEEDEERPLAAPSPPWLNRGQRVEVPPLREGEMAQRHMDRLTSFDTSFLANEKTNGHMAIGAVLVCEGSAPSHEDFLAHIRSRLHLLPRLRQRLSFPPLRLGTPFWVDHPSSTSQPTCAPSPCRRPGRRAQFRDLVGEPAGAAAGPLAAALGALAGRRLRGRSLRRSSTRPTTRSPTGSRRSTSACSSSTSSRETSPRARARPGSPIRPRRTCTSPARWRGGVLALLRRALLWGRRAAREPARALGGAVNDVSLAVAAGALRRWLHDRDVDTDGLELQALVPVSIRTEDEHGRARQPADGDAGPAAGPHRRPGRSGCACSRRRWTSSRPPSSRSGREAIWGLNDWFRDFAPPLLLAPTAAINFSTRLFNLLVTNFPGPQIPFYVLGRELTGVYPVGFLARATPSRSRSSATTAESTSACSPIATRSPTSMRIAATSRTRSRSCWPRRGPRRIALRPMATSWQEILDLGARERGTPRPSTAERVRAPRRLPPPAREPLEEPPGAGRGDLGQPLRPHRRRDLGAAGGGADPRRRRRADHRRGGRAARARGRLRRRSRRRRRGPRPPDRDPRRGRRDRRGRRSTSAASRRCC